MSLCELFITINTITIISIIPLLKMGECDIITWFYSNIFDYQILNAN